MNFQKSTLLVPQFAEMGLAPELLVALEKLGISNPTPIQSEATPVALTGADLVGVAQTGSGKTLAYGLAIITKLRKSSEGRALVLAPSRETAEQVFRVFSGLCEGAAPLSMCLAATGVPNAALLSQFKKNPRLIVATPGRLGDQLRGNKLLLKGLSVLVIDEADRMLDLGFEPQLKLIQSTLRGERQTLMFAASFGPRVEPVAKMFLNPEAIMIRSAGAETAVATLRQTVFFVKTSQKNHLLLDELKKRKGGVIVFADSKESCVALGRLLQHHEFSAEFMHGDMNTGHRTRVLREFRQQQIAILVTTDLLARGLDVPHVKHIINFDLPYKSEDFLHRIGRTARAGKEGSAVTFITPSDGRTFRKIRDYLKGAEEKTLASDFKFTDRD